MGIAAAVQKELGVIPGVEDLCAEVQPHAFVGKREMLDEGEIRVYKVRAIERCPVCVPKFPWRRVVKCARIKPSRQRTNPVGRATSLGNQYR
jgi:hypothetical protein